MRSSHRLLSLVTPSVPTGLLLFAVAAGFVMLTQTASAQDFDGAELDVSSEMEAYLETVGGNIDNEGTTIVAERRVVLRPGDSLSVSMQSLGRTEEHLFLAIVDGCDRTCRPGITLSRQILDSFDPVERNGREIPSTEIENTGDTFAARGYSARVYSTGGFVYSAKIHGATAELTVHLILVAIE